MFHKCFKITGTALVLWIALLLPKVHAQTTPVQNITVNGQVLDDYSRPLKNVLISVKGTSSNTLTNEAGTYEISAPILSTLVYNHPGFDVVESKIKNNKILSIKLSPAYLHSPVVADSGVVTQEKVNLLYGSTTADKLLGSVATIYSNQLSTTPATLYAYALPGRLAGLSVNQTSGFYTPKSSSLTDVDIFVGNIPKNNSGTGPSDNTEFNIQLRGHGASLGQSPITIVDGVQREIYSLDPESIESVSILKDALSTILLGQNSSRGALLVTTKIPQQGAPHLSFTAETGTQSSLGLPTPLPAYKYAYLLNEALLNDGRNAAYTAADFNAYRNGTDPIGHPDVNWYNTVINKNPLLSRYNLNVNGGGSMARYIISLSYLSQDGLFKTDAANTYNTNNQLKRYLINSKVEIDVNKNFNIGLQLFGRLQQGNQPGAGSAAILSNLLSTPNNAYAVFNPDGSYGGNANYKTNLLSMVQNSGYMNDNAKDVMANLDLTYRFDNWVKGLWVKAKGNVSVQNASLINRSKQAPVYNLAVSATGDSTYNRFGNIVNQVNTFTSTSWARYVFAQVSLGYDKKIGNHNFSTMLLYDKKTTLLNYDIPSALTNYAGKLSYDYNGKYFAEGALNYSGYDRYKPGSQFGLFYAGGLGWNIAKEYFISENAKWINLLKLRATYGRTGNANIDNYGYFVYRDYYQGVAGTYGMGSAYPNSGGLSENGTPGSQVLRNVNATWEKANKLDVGLDISLFSDHLQFTADYYHERYFDVLQKRGRSIELIGQGYPAENIAIDVYKGTELTATYQNNYKNLNYFITANAAFQASEVVFMDEQFQKYEWNKQTGHPVGQRYGLIADGFFQTAAEVNGAATIVGYTPHVGDFKYKDLNADGVIDQLDISPVGKEKPIIYYGLTVGFSYKGFAVSGLLQGVQNREMYVNNGYLDAGFQGQNNGFSQAYEQSLGRWIPENAAIANYPRLTAGGSGYNYNPMFTSNSYFLKDGNYFRLKNVNVEYNLPYNWIKKYKVAGIKFFVNGQNLLTWSAYDLGDPEVLLPNYPIQRVINAGINIKL
ncbi:MAG: TonB-dependent receptor [Ferruginibacter sp.]|nr:TonB-dependent receptor [Ferruginibacter sp.]